MRKFIGARRLNCETQTKTGRFPWPCVEMLGTTSSSLVDVPEVVVQVTPKHFDMTSSASFRTVTADAGSSWKMPKVLSVKGESQSLAKWTCEAFSKFKDESTLLPAMERRMLNDALNYWRMDMKPNTLGRRLRSMYKEPFATWLGSKEVLMANFAAGVRDCCKPTDFGPVPPGESKLSLVQRTTTLPEAGPELVTFVQRCGLDLLDEPQSRQVTSASYLQSICHDVQESLSKSQSVAIILRRFDFVKLSGIQHDVVDDMGVLELYRGLKWCYSQVLMDI